MDLSTTWTVCVLRLSSFFWRRKGYTIWRYICSIRSSTLSYINCKSKRKSCLKGVNLGIISVFVNAHISPKEITKNMKIAVVCDAHIFRTSRGEYWCTSVYGYHYFKRYMNVFEEVRVVSRVKEQEFPDNGKYLRVDGPNLEIHPVYFFRGPKEFLPNIGKVISTLKGFDTGCDVILYRIPSTTAQMAYLLTRKAKVPKGIEVVYNLYDELVDKTLSIPRKGISWLNHKCVKMACADQRVNGVSYVTKETLQRYYPSYCRMHGEDSLHFENYYSTIQYKSRNISSTKLYMEKKKWILIHVVVNIKNKVSGHETIIRAVDIVRKKGYDVEAEFVGDGPMVPYFKEMATSLGIAEHIHFAGLFSSPDDVYRELRKADLFVYPVHFAGLPRVLIEAMGSGLPCISSPVAGISELIAEEDLVDADDATALAKRIIEVVSNPEYLEEQSKTNIEKAKEYTDDKLQIRRDDFYRRLRECIDHV